MKRLVRALCAALLTMLLAQTSFAETGLCELYDAQDLNKVGNATQQANGNVRLTGPGDGVNFWMYPPVQEGTHEITFNMKLAGWGYYYPRVEVVLGNDVIASFRVTSTESTEYTVSFDIPRAGSSLPIGIRRTSSYWTYRMDVESVELACPVAEDQPGVLCGGDRCSGDEICCGDINECHESCPGPAGSRSLASCDGQDDCGDGVCYVQISNQGGGIQCAPGADIEDAIGVVPVVCGNSEEQTLSCPDGYYCERSTYSFQYRLCMPTPE